MPDEQDLSGLLGRYMQGSAGCTPKDLDAMAAAQEVDRLPDDYRSFMASYGRGDSRLFAGLAFFFPDCVDNKRYMLETLAESGSEFRPPPRAFVFSDAQGYDFWFFEDVEATEPIVSRWVEGVGVTRLYKQFGEWLDVQVRLWLYGQELDREFISKGLPAPPFQFSFEDYRTVT